MTLFAETVERVTAKLRANAVDPETVRRRVIFERWRAGMRSVEGRDALRERGGA